jgi:uncharacterized protein DUF4062
MSLKIRVFISSKQSEFENERAMLAHEIRNIPILEPVLAEEWNPTGVSVHKVYLDDVRTSPIYVGLFGGIYSEPTYLEYKAACENPYREKLIYLKQTGKVDPRLKELIGEFLDRHVPVKYRSLPDLLPVFSRHLSAALSRMVDTLQSFGEPRPVVHGSGTVLERQWANRQKHIRALGLPEDPGGGLVDDLIAKLADARKSLDRYAVGGA